MDRQAIALVGPRIMAQFALNYLGFGWVLAAFQLTYAFFQWPAGYLVDRWNVRRTYAGAVLWWSSAGIATAFAPTLGLLMTFRALVGMGESFNWPCALRVTSGVLPPSDRSLGNGIFNSGAAIGAVLTPLLVTPLAVRMGWRSPFVILGLGGLIWVAVWLMLTRICSPGYRPALPGGDGLGGLHGQLLCFRSGRRPEPHGSGDRVSRRTGQPVRGRIHACCRLDLPGPFRLHSQLYHHRPAPLGRTGRSARVLALWRQGCISAFVFFFREHGQFGSTSECAPWTGSKVFREPLVIAQGSCTHLQDRLGAFGIVPEHLGSFHPVVDLLDE